MKVPTLEEVLACGEQMCKDGKMDQATQDYYAEHGNHDIILSAEDMLFLDELEDMDVNDFFLEDSVQEEIILH